MFKLQIEPWDQVQSIEIVTLHGSITMKEEGDFVVYEHSEYGSWESVEYKFRVKKRKNYKQYVKKLAEVDVEPVDLKNLIGTMSYFREVYQHVLAFYRKGTVANLIFKWWDGEISVGFSLYAVKDKDEAEVQSKVSAEYGDEHIMLIHGEKSKDAENDLVEHTVKAAGLYLLFKEYVLQGEEPSKT